MDIFLKFTTTWIIPVIFFLAVFSFITMIIVELLDARLQLKAHLLDRSIRQILGARLRDRFFNNVIANPLGETKPPAYFSERLFARLLMHLLVSDYDFPSSRINPEYLELIVEKVKGAIKSLEKEAPIIASLLEYLLAQFIAQNIPSESNYEFFEEEIAQWFGHTLDRISSQYKALAGKMLMLVGTIVAVLANFDVINMVVILWKAALIKELADLYDKAGQPLTSIDTNLFTTLPLGWHLSDWEMLLANPIAFVLKIFGLGLGGFLIYVCAQYIYDYTKKRTNPIAETTPKKGGNDADKYYYEGKG